MVRICFIWLCLCTTIFSSELLAQVVPNELSSNLHIQIDSLFQLPQDYERDSALTVLLSTKIFAELTPSDSSTFRLERLNPLIELNELSQFPQTTTYLDYLKGIFYFRDGNYSLAINLFNSCLKSFKKHGNERMQLYVYNELSRIISLTLINDPTRDSQSREEFFDYSREGLKRAIELKDTSMIATYYVNLGLGHLAKKEYEKTKEYYHLSWDIIKNQQEKYWYKYYNGRWAEGLCDIRLGNTKDGFKYINEAIKVCNETTTPQSSYLKMVIGYLLGEYYLDQKMYREALEITDWGAKGNPILQVEFFNHFINKNYFRIYKQAGNYKKALAYFEEITAFNEKLENAETKGIYIQWANEQENIKKDNKIKALEVENLNQVTKRQKTLRNILIGGLIAITLLTLYILRNNRQIKEAYAELVDKNHEIETALFKGQHLERKRVASELHDTLATKVSALKWRMEALHAEVDTKNSEAFENIVRSLEELYTDIRFISHNLLPEELEKNGLKNTLTTLILKLNKLDKTQFHLVFDGISTKLETMILYEFYNIILELCNNILKHSNASDAYISVSQVNEQMFLTVTDNGTGLQENKASSGKGLKNIKNRIDSMDGKLSFESNEHGTKVIVVV